MSCDWLENCNQKICLVQQGWETKPQTAFKNLAEILITRTTQEIQAPWSLVFSVNDCLHRIIFVLAVTSLP